MTVTRCTDSHHIARVIVGLANLHGEFQARKEETMKASRRIGVLVGLMALAFLFNPDVTLAQNSQGCAWPIEWSAEGIGNWAIPDTYARWWVMPFDNYQTMTIKDTYPNARFFSISAYNTNSEKRGDGTSDHLYDVRIAPDPGGANPFVQPGAGNGTYTVVIKQADQASTNTVNTITVSSPFAWVLLRLYVPNADPSLSGRSLMGGVPLPTISVNGGSQPLQPCSPVNRLADVNDFRSILLPFDLIGSVHAPASDHLWFAPPTVPPPALLPNPDGKYMAMLPGDQYQPGRIIVIHGRAPGFSGTFQGSPIWVPSRGLKTVDMRYWSLCEVNFVVPLSMVACATDLTTKLEGDYYTIVISDDLFRPDWLRPNITWMPWGDEQYPKMLILRHMLTADNFPYSMQKVITSEGCTFPFTLPYVPDQNRVDTAGQCAHGVMGDYYPVAVWCDKSTFIAGGFQACLKE